MLNVILSLIIALVGCNSVDTPEKTSTIEPDVKYEIQEEVILEEDYTLKMIEEYEGINDNQKVFVDLPEEFKVEYLEEEDIKTFLEQGTGVVYFGWNTCPWCRNMLPVLIEELNDKEETLYYFNPQKIRGENNDTYNYIIDKVGMFLEKDDNGNPKLFVPEVLMLKEGKVVYHHLGTVDSQKDASIPLTEEQKEELKNIYREGINLIK